MTPWVRRLIIANVAVFVATDLLRVLPTFNLWLVPVLFPRQPWTLVTYMFLHAGLMHLLFNMLGLYFFGPRLEVRLGGRQFLILYFVSGISGGLLSFPFTPTVAIVGASGAVFGVLLGFARYWPRERIYIWGILPVEARGLVVAMTVLSLAGGFGAGGQGIAHFAHLGGFLGGFLFLKVWEHRSPAALFRAKAAPVQKRNIGSDAANLARWNEIRRDELHPVNREELDRILDKVGEAGVASLTIEERAFLERFSSRANRH